MQCEGRPSRMQGISPSPLVPGDHSPRRCWSAEEARALFAVMHTCNSPSRRRAALRRLKDGLRRVIGDISAEGALAGLKHGARPFAHEAGTH